MSILGKLFGDKGKGEDDENIVNGEPSFSMDELRQIHSSAKELIHSTDSSGKGALQHLTDDVFMLDDVDDPDSFDSDEPIGDELAEELPSESEDAYLELLKSQDFDNFLDKPIKDEEFKEAKRGVIERKNRRREALEKENAMRSGKLDHPVLKKPLDRDEVEAAYNAHLEEDVYSFKGGVNDSSKLEKHLSTMKEAQESGDMVGHLKKLLKNMQEEKDKLVKDINYVMSGGEPEAQSAFVMPSNADILRPREVKDWDDGYLNEDELDVSKMIMAEASPEPQEGPSRSEVRDRLNDAAEGREKAPRGDRICPKTTKQLIRMIIRLGEKMSGSVLRPYQRPFAIRILESLIDEEAQTITGLFSRQCVSIDTVVSGPTARFICEVVEGHKIHAHDSKGALNVPASYMRKEVGVRGSWKADAKKCYEVKSEMSNCIVVGIDHKFKRKPSRSVYQWQSVEQGLKQGDEIEVSFKPLYDKDGMVDLVSAAKTGVYTFPLSKEGEAKCFFAAQMLLYKGRADSFLLQVANRDVVEMAEITGVDFQKKRDCWTELIEVDKNMERKLLEFAYRNPYTTLKYLLKSSEVSKCYIGGKGSITISTFIDSDDRYRTLLKHFLCEHGLINVMHKNHFEIISQANVLRLAKFFENDELFKEHITIGLEYNFKSGPRCYGSSVRRILSKYPVLKSLIHTVTASKFRKEGANFWNILRLCARAGISEQQLYCDGLFPNRYWTYVTSVTPVYSEMLWDIETDNEEFLANQFVVHNSGKTEAISVISDALMVLMPMLNDQYPDDVRFQKFKDGIWIGIFSPSLDQSKTTFDRMRSKIMTDEAKQILKECHIRFKTNRGDTIKLSNGSFTRCQTASDGAHIESKTYHLIIIEEAQDVSPFKIRKSIRPMGASTAATIVMVGTANTVINELYNAKKNNLRIQKTKGIVNHFQVDYEEVIKHSREYAKFIKQEKEQLGEDSDEFRMSYNNEFIFERGMAFTDVQLSYKTALNPYGLINPKLEAAKVYRGRLPVSVGIDVGKNKDSTVCMATEIDIHNPIYYEHFVAYRKRTFAWLEMLGDNYDKQHDYVKAFLRNVRATTCLMDITGKGEPMYDFLHAELEDEITFIPVTFNQKTKHLIYTNLLHDCNAARIELPGGVYTRTTREYNRCLFQCRTLIKQFNGPYVDCHKPSDKIDGIEPHDDYPDAWALSAYGGKEEVHGEVEISDDSPYKEKGRNPHLIGRNEMISKRGHA